MRFWSASRKSGVTEKKTHSSSIDEDAAIRLRRLYGFDVPDYVPSEAADEAERLEPELAGGWRAEPDATAAASAPAPVAHLQETPAPERLPEASGGRRCRNGIPSRGAGSTAPGISSASSAGGGRTRRERARRARGAGGAANCSRNPYAGNASTCKNSTRDTSRDVRSCCARARDARACSAAPSTALAPGPAGCGGHRTGAPARAIRETAANQRQARPNPFRTAPTFPFHPGRGSAAGCGNAAPTGRNAAAGGSSESARAGSAQTGPMTGPVPPRTLAGQPVTRPVVPPRPDLAARLAPSRPVMPAQPAAPRPGVPKPHAPPTPGQPIYRGPIRPGQPHGGPPGPGRARARPRPARPPARVRSTRPRARPGMDPGLAPPPMDQPRAAVLATSAPPRPAARTRRGREGPCGPQVRRHVEAGPPPINREITISEGITVKELSEKLDVKASPAS